MTRGRAAAALGAGVLAAVVVVGGDARAALETATASPARSGVERHHYSIAARVRPLLLFWIGRSGVGDAVVTRRVSPEETTYTLLIGSDPERAPRHINRWGYIQEEIRGADARLIGLMTASDEDSLEDAQAGIRKQADGDHAFKIIRSTVTGEHAESVVTSVEAPYDYSFRQLQAVLDLAQRDRPNAKRRTVQIPPGTRPGFLAALADAMQPRTDRVTYVYHGRLYDLRRTDTRAVPDVRIGDASYGPSVAADFTITSKYDGERFRFSMTYGAEGRFAQVPLTVSYRPRWWMEVNLTLDDRSNAAATDGVGR